MARLLRHQFIQKTQSSNNPFLGPKPAAWVVPFPRNSRFVDRESFGQLRRKLYSQKNPQRTAVFGLGGVGKTQLALELAYQTRERWPEHSIFWIPAVDHESLRQAYEQVAWQLGFTQFEIEKEDAKLLVQQRLSQPDSGPWLIIFDNADDWDMWAESSSHTGKGLKGFLPRSDQGTIVFTTRSRRVAHHLASTDVIEIPEMDESRAISMLRNCLYNKELLHDLENTRILLERLTFLPLAIAQAASFINENDTNIAGYIRLLDGQEQDAIDLLSEDFEDEGRYKSVRNPVATTWLTSFKQLEEQSPLAAECLSVMACYNHRDIPIDLLPIKSHLLQEKTIGILCSYSFVRARQSDRFLDMHRLVHLAMRNLLRSTGTLSHWQWSAAHHVSPFYPSLPHDVKAEQYLLRTAISHGMHLLENGPEKQDFVWACLIYTTSYRLYLVGRIQEAEKFCLQAVEWCKTVEQHEEVQGLDEIEGHNSLLMCQIFNCQGRYEEAEKFAKCALECYTRVFGEENMHSTRVIQLFGVLYFRMDRLSEAEKFYRRALQIRLKNEGLTFPSLSSMCALTQIYIARGQLHNAYELAMQTRDIVTKVYGPKTPMLLSTISTLAAIHYERWALDKAVQFAKEAFEGYRDIFGPESLVTLESMQTFAGMLHGKHGAEAVHVMAECARLAEKALGSSNPRTLSANETLEIWAKQRYVFSI